MCAMKNGPNILDVDALTLWRTRTGETEAFSEIVERHQLNLMRVSCSYLGDKEEAREAAQEIFLKVYTARKTFNYDKPFKPWFYSIALNHLKSRYKTLKRQEEKIIAVASQPCASRIRDPLELVEERELRMEIRSAILGLPTKLQGCTMLYYLEEMEIDEICLILGIGRENVKSRLFRARKKLKVILSDLSG